MGGISTMPNLIILWQIETSNYKLPLDVGYANRFFSLRQPNTLTGLFCAKVALHEGPLSGSGTGGFAPDFAANPVESGIHIRHHNHRSGNNHPTVFQPTSLLPDWR